MALGDNAAFFILGKIEVDLGALKRSLDKAEQEVNRSANRQKKSWSNMFSGIGGGAGLPGFGRAGAARGLGMLAGQAGFGGATGVFGLARAFGPIGAAASVAALGLRAYVNNLQDLEKTQGKVNDALAAQSFQQVDTLWTQATEKVKGHNATLVSASREVKGFGDAAIKATATVSAMWTEITGGAKLAKEELERVTAARKLMFDVFEKGKLQREDRKEMQRVDEGLFRTQLQSADTVERLNAAYKRVNASLEDKLRLQKQDFDDTIRGMKSLRDQMPDARDREIMDARILAVQQQKQRMVLDFSEQLGQADLTKLKRTKELTEATEKFNDTIAGEDTKRRLDDLKVKMEEAFGDVKARYDLQVEQIRITDDEAEKAFKKEKARLEALIEKDQERVKHQRELDLLEAQRETKARSTRNELKVLELGFERSKPKEAYTPSGLGATFAPFGSGSAYQVGDPRGFASLSGFMKQANSEVGNFYRGIEESVSNWYGLLRGEGPKAKDAGPDKILKAAGVFENAANTIARGSLGSLGGSDASSQLGRLGQLEARRGPSPNLAG